MLTFPIRRAAICNCALFMSVYKLLPAYVCPHTHVIKFLLLQLLAMNFKYGWMTARRTLKYIYLFSFHCSNVGWRLPWKSRQTKSKSEKKTLACNFISTLEFVISSIWFECFPLWRNAAELFGLLVLSALEIIVWWYKIPLGSIQLTGEIDLQDDSLTNQNGMWLTVNKYTCRVETTYENKLFVS